MARVVTFGTFDLFHIGHLNILQRARQLGDWLSVGISTDEMSFAKKRVLPSFPYAHRSRIVAALRCVDAVFPEESLALKRRYLEEQNADVLVMGHDWSGRFDEFEDIVKVVYLPRTADISTTEIRERILTAGQEVAR